MQKAILFVVALFFIYPVSVNSTEITISEIMFNPAEGSEWIEFFYSGDEMTDISGLKISDNLQTDEIMCCNLSLCDSVLRNNSYFLIAEQESNLNFSEGQTFCVDDNAIGNGLGNLEDKVVLFKANQTYVTFSYNQTVEKGNSLSYYNGSWYESKPTPLMSNELLETSEEVTNSADLDLTISLQPNLFTYVSYDSLFKVRNTDYPKSKDRISFFLFYNISKKEEQEILIKEGAANLSLISYTTQGTGNIEFNTTGNFVICGKIYNQAITDPNPENDFICGNFSIIDSGSIRCNIGLSIKTEKTIYDNGEKIEFYVMLSNTSFPFDIEYWIEDLYKESIKERIITSNTNKKSYTPKTGLSEKVFLIKANLTKMACNNTNKDTFTETYFVVKGERKQESLLKIEKINIPSTGKVSFGEVLKAYLSIYKGDTAKRSVKIYIEKEDKKISEIVYMDLSNKFQQYDLTLPIPIKNNCDKKYKEGKYFLIVEGLDKRISEELEITDSEDSSCNKYEEPTTKIAETKKDQYELLDFTKIISSDEITSTIIIRNNENVSHNYSVWSYIYKGAISYSGGREDNLEEITLSRFSENIITLKNKIINPVSGNYNLKIKILREDRKTPYEITENISAESKKKEEEVLEENLQSETPENLLDNIKTASNLSKEANEMPEEKITSNVVYLSSNEKIKKYSFVFLIVLLFLAVLFFVKKNNFFKT